MILVWRFIYFRCPGYPFIARFLPLLEAWLWQKWRREDGQNYRRIVALHMSGEHGECCKYRAAFRGEC